MFVVDFELLPIQFGTTEAPFVHATIDRVVVGMIQIRTPYQDGICPFLNLWVDESSRKIGIGSYLVRAARIWASAKGAAALSGLVEESNQSALGFYKRLGFFESEEKTETGNTVVNLLLN